MAPSDDLQAVLTNELNEAALARLEQQLLSPLGVIPWVGAGTSVPLGFPEWTGLLYKKAKLAGSEEEVRQLIDDGEYERAAEALVDGLGEQEFQDTFAVTFGPARLEGRRLGGVFELLPKLADGPVITTNFDRALEIAFEQAGRRFDEVIRGAEIDTFSDALTLNRRFLLNCTGTSTSARRAC
jgi:hypothetical protein